MKCVARLLSQCVESWRCTNSQHRKKLCLSLLMSKSLKLKKVIKSFVPEPILCFSDSYMFMNLCERFPYPYEYVYFTCSYLGRIFLDVWYYKNSKKYLPGRFPPLVLHTHLLMHNDPTIKTSDTVLRKIYLSLYLKGLCVRGSWRSNRTATYWPPQLLRT